MILIYVMVSLVALFAFVSLAVDYGHVQVAKAQLQQAADSAARYAAIGIADGTATAKAIAAAQDNTVDGTPVHLAASDIQVGNWDPNATPQFSTTRSPTNAVRITASRTAAKGNAVRLFFGQIAGAPTCDVSAHALVLCEPGRPGVVGLNGISVKNNALIASYNSSTNTNPTPGNSNSNGSVGSNGTVDGKNNNTIKGSVKLGPGADVDGFDVSGSTSHLSDPLVLPDTPAWSPTSNPGGVPQAYTVSSAQTLAGGTYWFTSLNIKAPLSFSGRATLIVNGDILLDSSLTALGKSPANLVVFQLGTGRTFGDDKNNMDFTAIIVAPGSDFLAKNNFVARGSFIFNTITAKNNFEMYYDEAISNSASNQGSSSPVVTTVQ